MIRHFSHIFLVDAETFIGNRIPDLIGLSAFEFVASGIPQPSGVGGPALRRRPIEDVSFLPQKSTGPGRTGNEIVGHCNETRQIFRLDANDRPERSRLVTGIGLGKSTKRRDTR